MKINAIKAVIIVIMKDTLKSIVGSKTIRSTNDCV